MPYLTPTSIPSETVCFLIQIPDDELLKSAVFGALLNLIYTYNWEQSDGGLTPSETVEFTSVWYQEIMEMMCMGICDDIVSGCLDNPEFNADIFDALLPLGVGAGGGGSPTQIDEIDDTEIGSLSEGCTDAERYGVAYSIAEMLNVISRDFFQIMELSTNAIEAGARLLDAIPVFGGYLSQIVDTIDWILEYADEAYNAGWTSITHEQVACEIFCLYDDCELTISTLRQAYRNIVLDLEPPLPTSVFIDFINWMTPLVVSITPLQIVGIVHLFVLEVMVRGSSFLGSSYRVLQVAGALAGTLPPPAECLCGDEWCLEYDYTIDDYGFVLAQNDANRGGTWNTGVGWQLHSNTGFQVNLGHNIATPYQIIRFEIDINVTALPGSGNIGLSNLAETQFSTPYVIPTTGTQTISITKDITWAGGSGWKLYAVALGASQLQFTLQSIRITGSGTKEAGVPDC